MRKITLAFMSKFVLKSALKSALKFASKLMLRDMAYTIFMTLDNISRRVKVCSVACCLKVARQLHIKQLQNQLHCIIRFYRTMHYTPLSVVTIMIFYAACICFCPTAQARYNLEGVSMKRSDGVILSAAQITNGIAYGVSIQVPITSGSLLQSGTSNTNALNTNDILRITAKTADLSNFVENCLLKDEVIGIMRGGSSHFRCSSAVISKDRSIHMRNAHIVLDNMSFKAENASLLRGGGISAQGDIYFSIQFAK